MSLPGPDGLLKQFTKSVLETALNEEMTEHLGHAKRRALEDRDSTNIWNGTRPKMVLTEATGQVEIEVPRDRDASFEPQIVKKRQRRLIGADEIVLSLYSKGLTTGEISAHFAEIYGPSPTAGRQQKPTDEDRRKHRSRYRPPRCGVPLSGPSVPTVSSVGGEGGSCRRALG